MKKLGKLKLNNFKEMSDQEMKSVTVYARAKSMYRNFPNLWWRVCT